MSRYYVPWDDFRRLLSKPRKHIWNPAAFTALLVAECGFGAIGQRVIADRYPTNQVFVNLVPIVMNAATRVFAA